MLQTMQQGVFTIVEGGLIHSEYSAFLEKIVGTDEISGRSCMDVLFRRSTLTEDELSQLDTVISSILSDDVMM